MVLILTNGHKTRKNGTTTKLTFSRDLAPDSATLAILRETKINVILPPRKEAVYDDYSLFTVFSYSNEDVLPGGAVDVDGEKAFCKDIRDERSMLL